jgi:hypothetical protein
MGQERWSSIWDGRRRPPLAAYPRLGRCGSHLAAYLALLRLGVTLPPLLPVVRWALTPPFHPYPDLGRTLDPGGFFSVALSVALRRPGVTWQPTLWSSDFPRIPCGTRDHPSDQWVEYSGEGGKREAAKCREADLFPLSSWNSSSYFSRLLPRLPHSRESPLRLLQKWEQCRIGSLPLRQHLAVLFPRFGSAAQSLVSGTPEEPYPAQHPPT